MVENGKHINIVNNFIDQEDIDKIINFIDNNLESFRLYQDNTRYVLKFGKDFTFHYSSRDFSQTKELEPLFREKLFPKMLDTIKYFYGEHDLKTSLLWLSKHLPGSTIPTHHDHDGKRNSQLEYSAILYLNSLDNTGILEFPWSNFSYTPVAGDLVIFPSEDIDFENQFAHRVSEINEIRYTVPVWFAKPDYSL